MKKQLLMLGMAAMLAMPMTAKAGGVYEGPAKGTSIVGARLGLSGIVGVNATYDYALARVWKGTFTIGGQIGYMWDGKTQNEAVWGVKVRASENWHHLSFRVRTTYRFNVVVPQWEVYGGVALGGSVTMHDYKVRVEGQGTTVPDESSHGTSGWVSGAFILGTTYHFTDVIGLNLEFDFGDWASAWVNLGVNFRF